MNTLLELYVPSVLVWNTVALNPSTQGHTFYTGFINMVDVSEYTKKFQLKILTLNENPVTFNVSSGNDFQYSGSTTLNNPELVNIPASHEVHDYTYKYRNLGLIIESSPSEPIFVIGIITLTYMYDDEQPFSAFEVHPYIEQPADKFVYYGISFGENVDFHSQLLLVGCKDDTTISIIPSKNITLSEKLQEPTNETIIIQAGNSYVLSLHKLQTLILYNDYDITGTKIVSNKPLTVISGHSCTNIPAGFAYCDAITTQVPPTITWGKTFILPPLSERKNGQRYKIIASENNTEINIHCNKNTVINIQFINEGEVYQFDTGHNEYCSVITSMPCYIAEAGFGNAYLNENYGDPLMLTVPPLEQYPKSDVIIAPIANNNENFYTIIIPDDYYTGSFLLNQSITCSTSWIPINYSNGSIAGYGYSAPLNGITTISSFRVSGKFLVVAYGFTIYKGFGFTPNMEFNPINIPPVYIRFVSPVYYALEENEKIVVSIEKESSTFIENVSVKICTKKYVRTFSNDMLQYASTEEIYHTPIDKIVILKPDQELFNLTVALVDDHTHETEYLTLKMISLEVNVFIKAAEAVIVIDDADGMVIYELIIVTS